MHKHTTLHTTASTQRSSTPACTTTHKTHTSAHNKITNHSDLQLSFTVVMVLLEPKAALNSFKPASVTL